MGTLIKNINLSTARKHFPALVDQVSATNNPVRIVRKTRSGRSALLVPEEYEPIINRDVGWAQKIAFLFTDSFFNGAPPHIKNSQRKELETLPSAKLSLLLEIKSFPLERKLRGKLVSAIGHEIIEHLEKRKDIADSIIEAEKEGLYEREEHYTSLLDFE